MPLIARTGGSTDGVCATTDVVEADETPASAAAAGLRLVDAVELLLVDAEPAVAGEVPWNLARPLTFVELLPETEPPPAPAATPAAD
jgi:hypothetical protein